MRSLRLVLLALAAPAVAHADTAISFEKVAAAQVPAALKPKGAVDLAWRWKDKNGDNYLVSPRTLPSTSLRRVDGSAGWKGIKSSGRRRVEGGKDKARDKRRRGSWRAHDER